MSQVAANQSVMAVDQSAGVEQIVQSAIAEITHIATLPEITLKVIQLVEDPDSTAQDLNNLISNDPALGSRILKVVNSSFYGLSGQIGSINRAIVLLGLNALKNVAIAASLAKLFRGGEMCPSFNARDLWSHSIAVASATQMLAQKVELSLPDEAFLAGLMHDLGIMVEMQARPAQFVKVVEKVTADATFSFRQAEIDVLGASHEDFGAALCRTWKFPVRFASVAGFHHRPLDGPEDNWRLTTLVHIGDILAARLELGYTRTVDADQIDPTILGELNLNEVAIAEISEALPQAVEEAAALMKI